MLSDDRRERAVKRTGARRCLVSSNVSADLVDLNVKEPFRLEKDVDEQTDTPRHVSSCRGDPAIVSRRRITRRRRRRAWSGREIVVRI